MIAETGNCSPSMTPSTDHRAVQKKIQLIPVPIWSSARDVPHEPPSAPMFNARVTISHLKRRSTFLEPLQKLTPGSCRRSGKTKAPLNYRRCRRESTHMSDPVTKPKLQCIRPCRRQKGRSTLEEIAASPSITGRRAARDKVITLIQNVNIQSQETAIIRELFGATIVNAMLLRLPATKENQSVVRSPKWILP